VNILLVTPDFPPNCGGGGRVASNLVDEFTEKGHNVTVISGKIGGTISEEDRHYQLIRLPCYFFGIERQISQLKYSLPPTPHSINYARSIDLSKFDVIHLFAFPFHPLVDLFGFLSPPEDTVLTIHAFPNFFQTDGIGRLFSPVSKVYERVVSRKVVSNASKITAVSESTRNDAIGFGINPDKIEVIWNGIDSGKYMRKDEETQNNLVATVGRVTPHKRFEDVISAIANIDGIHLKIIGPVENDTYMEKLEGRAEKVGVSNRVSFEGFISEDKKINLLSRSSLYVAPSESEGFGLTLLEAMAAETPVIATDIKGHRDVINDGVNGVLYDCKDVNGLTKRIDQLLREPDTRAGLVTKGKKTALNNDWEIIAEEYLDCYLTIVYDNNIF